MTIADDMPQTGSGIQGGLSPNVNVDTLRVGGHQRSCPDSIVVLYIGRTVKAGCLELVSRKGKEIQHSTVRESCVRALPVCYTL